MTPEQTEDFRGILTARAAALGAEVRDMDADRVELLTQARDETEDAGDEAESRRDDEVRNAEEDRDAMELRDVGDALARIDAGTYGECVDCDVEIPIARLQAQPAAARCIACQEAVEERQARAA